MRKYIIEQSQDETYTSHAGLGLVGLALNRFTSLSHLIARSANQEKGIPHADIVRSYAGLLAMGKSDYEAIEGHRDDSHFHTALGVDEVPASATLRQQFDEHATDFVGAVNSCVTEVVHRGKGTITPLDTGHVPLDIDVFPMDNSNTKKECVGRTYKNHDGFAPIAAYLGMEGWALEVELRPGTQHSQKNFIPFLNRVILQARILTRKKLLVRLDSAHDAIDTRITLREAEKVSHILKWNPRNNTAAAEWYEFGFANGEVTEPRPGKRVALFTKRIAQMHEGRKYIFTRVMRLVERTIDKHGQMVITPELEIEGWWTSLDLPAEKIIKLYENHGLSEQFHSEFKTDLDLERLPSGKFATNALIMSLAALVYNVLRLIGQEGLLGANSPVRHSAKRRRLKTVLQEFIYVAARVISSGRRLKLRFSRHCPGFEAFSELYTRFAQS
jgi:hypothetical protein